MIQDIRIMFTAGNTITSWLIRRLDRAYVDGGRTVPSKINHVGLRIIYNNGPDLICQSHGLHGVGLCFTSDLKRAVSDGKVYRYAEKSLCLHQWQMAVIERRMAELTGAGYDYWMIAIYYLAIRLHFRKPSAGVYDRYTCNELVATLLSGIVPWIRDDGTQTPEVLFAAAFAEPSPFYFENHPAICFG